MIDSQKENIIFNNLIANNHKQILTTTSNNAKIEISKISQNLRDILSVVQKNTGNGSLSDSLNEKVLEILSNFRKIEEQLKTSSSSSPQLPCKACFEYKQKCSDQERKMMTMSEDYQKLKNIMDSL